MQNHDLSSLLLDALEYRLPHPDSTQVVVPSSTTWMDTLWSRRRSGWIHHGEQSGTAWQSHKPKGRASTPMQGHMHACSHAYQHVWYSQT